LNSIDVKTTKSSSLTFLPLKSKKAKTHQNPTTLSSSVRFENKKNTFFNLKKNYLAYYNAGGGFDR
jgi:hypothetical protein